MAREVTAEQVADWSKDVELVQFYTTRKALKAEKAAVEERLDIVESVLKRVLKNGGVAVAFFGPEQGLSYGVTAPSEMFDTKRFAKEHPDLYKKYLKEKAGYEYLKDIKKIDLQD
jgi:predicted phage-related endonuclease